MSSSRSASPGGSKLRAAQQETHSGACIAPRQARRPAAASRSEARQRERRAQQSYWSQRFAVAVRLFEVVAEDLVVLRDAIADTCLEPVGERS